MVPASRTEAEHGVRPEKPHTPGNGVSETFPTFPLADIVDLTNNGGSHLLAMVGGNL